MSRDTDGFGPGFLSGLFFDFQARLGAFLLSFAMDDHQILILSILVGMAAAGIAFGTFLVHAHGLARPAPIWVALNALHRQHHAQIKAVCPLVAREARIGIGGYSGGARVVCGASPFLPHLPRRCSAWRGPFYSYLPRADAAGPSLRSSATRMPRGASGGPPCLLDPVGQA